MGVRPARPRSPCRAGLHVPTPDPVRKENGPSPVEQRPVEREASVVTVETVGTEACRGVLRAR